MDTITPKLKVYLAGPDVFRKDAEFWGNTLKTLCAAVGFEPLWPPDGAQADPFDGLGQAAKRIFHGNAELIQRADIILANIEPFRGPGMDAGTAWEIGCAWAWNKPVFAYTKDARTYHERVAPVLSAVAEGFRADYFDAETEIEDFGLAENLMIACSVRGVSAGFAEALQAAADWAAVRA